MRGERKDRTSVEGKRVVLVGRDSMSTREGVVKGPEWGQSPKREGRVNPGKGTRGRNILHQRTSLHSLTETGHRSIKCVIHKLILISSPSKVHKLDMVDNLVWQNRIP